MGLFFRIKLIARLILKREISGSHTISYLSLLLSTIVLNDNNGCGFSLRPRPFVILIALSAIALKKQKSSCACLICYAKKMVGGRHTQTETHIAILTS